MRTSTRCGYCGGGTRGGYIWHGLDGWCDLCGARGAGWNDGLHVGCGVLSGVRRLGGGGISSRSVRGTSTEGGWGEGGREGSK